MGEIIAYNAATDDILADAEATWQRASVCGGLWSSLAAPFFEALLQRVARAKAELSAAEEVARRAHAAQALIARDVHVGVAGVHDALWQDLGRPAHDLHLTLVYPRGAGSHTSGAMGTRPARIRLAAALLREHVHPRLSRQRCEAAADVLEALAERLQGAIDARNAAKSNRDRLATLKRTLARATHRALVNYKRTLLAHDLRQAEIHTVIPAHARRSRGRAEEQAPIEGTAPAETPASETPDVASPPAARSQRIAEPPPRSQPLPTFMPEIAPLDAPRDNSAIRVELGRHRREGEPDR